jgi:hypothetical protein
LEIAKLGVMFMRDFPVISKVLKQVGVVLIVGALVPFFALIIPWQPEG